MRVNFVIVFVISIFEAIFSKNPPQWSRNYKIKGTIHFPFANIQQPFETWYDTKNKRVRYDFHDGMVQEYEIVSTEGSKCYRILPTTHQDDQLPQNQCFIIETLTKKAPLLLPNLHNFMYNGTETVNRVKCDRFKLIDSNELYTRELTMWIGYKKTNDEKQPNPVKFETKYFHSDTMNLRDQFWMSFKSYKPGIPGDKIFQIPVDCKDLSGDQSRKSIPELPGLAEIDKRFEDFADSPYRQILKKNLQYIESMNQANLGFRLAPNHFIDKTSDEIVNFSPIHLDDNFFDSMPLPNRLNVRNLDPIPESFNWVDRGAVSTTVLDQADCGACWAFAAGAAIESANFLKTGQYVPISLQSMMDCSWRFGNYGCSGGTSTRAYRWIIKAGGIPTAMDYGSYLGIEGYCHSQNLSLVAPVKGYVRIPPGNIEIAKRALIENGPLAVGIDGSLKSFQFYSNGIFYDPNCKSERNEQNHAVLLVGFGKNTQGREYWIVKNNWSKYWGQNGFMYLDVRNGSCGILNHATYPVM